MSDSRKLFRELCPLILQGHFTILTGKVGCGKSTWLEKLVSFLKAEHPEISVGGILCRGIFEGDSKIGYHLVDLKSGRETLFALQKDVIDQGNIAKQTVDHAPLSRWRSEIDHIPAEKHQQVGQWWIFENTIETAEDAIRKSIQDHSSLTIIDEFGPLEFQGKGFRSVTDELTQIRKAALLVVRQDLLENFKKLYQPWIASILMIDSDRDHSVRILTRGETHDVSSRDSSYPS